MVLWWIIPAAGVAGGTGWAVYHYRKHRREHGSRREKGLMHSLETKIGGAVVKGWRATGAAFKQGKWIISRERHALHRIKKDAKHERKAAKKDKGEKEALAVLALEGTNELDEEQAAEAFEAVEGRLAGITGAVEALLEVIEQQANTVGPVKVRNEHEENDRITAEIAELQEVLSKASSANEMDAYIAQRLRAAMKVVSDLVDKEANAERSRKSGLKHTVRRAWDVAAVLIRASKDAKGEMGSVKKYERKGKSTWKHAFKMAERALKDHRKQLEHEIKAAHRGSKGTERYQAVEPLKARIHAIEQQRVLLAKIRARIEAAERAFEASIGQSGAQAGRVVHACSKEEAHTKALNQAENILEQQLERLIKAPKALHEAMKRVESSSDSAVLGAELASALGSFSGELQIVNNANAHFETILLQLAEDASLVIKRIYAFHMLSKRLDEAEKMLLQASDAFEHLMQAIIADPETEHDEQELENYLGLEAKAATRNEHLEAWMSSLDSVIVGRIGKARGALEHVMSVDQQFAARMGDQEKLVRSIMDKFSGQLKVGVATNPLRAAKRDAKRSRKRGRYRFQKAA